MMAAVGIRPARADDAEALSRLLGQLGYPSDAAQIPDRLIRLNSRPGTTAFVAEDRGKVVGCVTVHLFPALRKPLPPEAIPQRIPRPQPARKKRK